MGAFARCGRRRCQWQSACDGHRPEGFRFGAPRKGAYAHLATCPELQNEQWNSELLASAIATPEARTRLVNSLIKLVNDNHFAGITIDLEEVPANSQNNLFEFMRELHESFGQRGYLLAQAVPFDNPDWNYRRYAEVTDYLMLMAYDEHWSTSQPGSIASQKWFEETLAGRMRELDAAHTILCIGSYGYNWSNRRHEAEDITFQEAVLAARDSQAKINFDPATRNPFLLTMRKTALITASGFSIPSRPTTSCARRWIFVRQAMRSGVWAVKTRASGKCSARRSWQTNRRTQMPICPPRCAESATVTT
jgi:hypothetical protein